MRGIKFVLAGCLMTLYFEGILGGFRVDFRVVICVRLETILKFVKIVKISIVKNCTKNNKKKITAILKF